MRKFLFLLGCTFCLATALQTKGYSQKKAPRVMVYGKQGSGDTDLILPEEDKPRIKNKKRGTCYLYLDNYTKYFVDVWVEKEYQGRLSPNTIAVRFDVWTAGNWTHWSAKTVGKSYYWKNDSYCNDRRVFRINLK